MWFSQREPFLSHCVGGPAILSGVPRAFPEFSVAEGHHLLYTSKLVPVSMKYVSSDKNSESISRVLPCQQPKRIF